MSGWNVGGEEFPDVRYLDKVECWPGKIPDVRHSEKVECWPDRMAAVNIRVECRRRRIPDVRYPDKVERWGGQNSGCDTSEEGGMLVGQNDDCEYPGGMSAEKNFGCEILR